MFHAVIQRQPVGGKIRASLVREDVPITYAEVIRLWRDDMAFRAWFNDLLAGIPFGAFRWETPPITSDTAQQPFECVIHDGPELARPPDPGAFAAHFGREAMARGAVAFPNLGKDAVMVVPCPLGPSETYVHLASFVRGAPEAQRQALWQLVGESMAQRLGARPVWLSTAGAGVAWLHVRLDDRPKYYGHVAYRKAP